MMREFEALAQTGKYASKGWPSTTYGVSKIGLSALSRIQQQQFDVDRPTDDIVVNHLSPGYVDTDMSSHMGPLSIDEGAMASIYAATLPPNTQVRGKYIWEDCTIKDWVK